MNAGKEFEKDFRQSIPKNCYYRRFNDNALGFNIQASNQRFTTKSPYDSIIYHYPYFYALELKSTQGKSISFGGNSPMIKEHQIKELVKASHFEGVISGFVFNFRGCENRTIFVPVHRFLEIARNNGKKSVNVNEFNNDNSIEIPNKLLKVHYKYDINTFMEWAETLIVSIKGGCIFCEH